MAVQKLDKDTFVIGTHTYIIGKCKNFLKKDLQAILKTLGVTFRAKDTNAVLCELIDAFLKASSTPKPPTGALAPVETVAVLEPGVLVYKKKRFSLSDCKTAFRDVKKDELQQILTLLSIPFTAKATKENLCATLRKASQQTTGQAAPVPALPKSNIFLDGVPISLDKCASFDEPLLRALAKAVGTTYSKDKTVLCNRIQKKYTGSIIKLYAEDFASTKKTKTKKQKEPTPKEPTPKAPTPKEPTPKAPTPKEPTPKAPTPKEPDVVFDADGESVQIAGHTFYFGKCDKNRAYKLSALREMATTLGIVYKVKDTGKSLCHKIEAAVKALKKAGTPPSAKPPTPPGPSPLTKAPTPPKSPSAAPLFPSPLKAMTAEEIREAVRKCLNL